MLHITDAELSLLLNFLQALALAWIGGKQQRTASQVKETNRIVKNGHGEHK